MSQLAYALTFYLAAAAALAFALGVVLARRVMYSALSLVAALCCVAVVFLLLSADFLAGVQILIYAGAIMTLIVFAIMLTPGQVDLPSLAPAGQRLAAGIVALAFLAVTALVLLSTPWPVGPKPLDQPTTGLLGNVLFTAYALPFEIASVLLLAAMVGAIVIAREE